MPPRIRSSLEAIDDASDLLEIVLDLGRKPEARFLKREVVLDDSELTADDITQVVSRLGAFTSDNRAGIPRTLHRISAIRNRTGDIVGLTCRIGRAVIGTIEIIRDLVESGKSPLLLGSPGVGKTTLLRDVARVLADESHKRVIVVDTSNEIAGDGDIPHAGIGRARRMQVPSSTDQHKVMIEAVENHMPEVIVIDEIGTELEAEASRTIAERGVQLVATAHGNTLENLIMNPTLCDLIGGIDSVTLGDEEAKRRRTQKTVLERRAPPTFDALVQIQGWSDVTIHTDVADSVDRMLRGYPVTVERRTLGEAGGVESRKEYVEPTTLGENGRRPALEPSGPVRVVREGSDEPGGDPSSSRPGTVTRILPYGVNKDKLRQAVRTAKVSVEVVGDISTADILLTTKNFYRRRTQALNEAESLGRPVYVLRKNTAAQIHQFLRALDRGPARKVSQDAISDAVKEAEEAASRLDGGEHRADLSPQVAYIRRLQHQFAEQRGLASSSSGREPSRRVVLYRR
jgi:stage III sporulation protein SpoIIIAA